MNFAQVDTLVQLHIHAFRFLIIIAYLNRLGTAFLLEAIEFEITIIVAQGLGNPASARPQQTGPFFNHE